MTLPAKPTPELINIYLKKWDTLENYLLQEKSLVLLFHQFCPLNNVLEHVMLKVTALNQFYSTRIFDTYSVAKHIVQMDIDRRLKIRDLSLVNELAKITIQGKTINFYSFASKYCSHHVADGFPIYDSFVEKMLWHYRKADHFYVFRKGELKIYPKFVNIVTSFQKHYDLEPFSFKEIDNFLWQEGKKCFQESNRKKKTS